MLSRNTKLLRMVQRCPMANFTTVKGESTNLKFLRDQPLLMQAATRHAKDGFYPPVKSIEELEASDLKSIDVRKVE